MLEAKGYDREQIYRVRKIIDEHNKEDIVKEL